LTRGPAKRSLPKKREKNLAKGVKDYPKRGGEKAKEVLEEVAHERKGEHRRLSRERGALS